MNDAGALDLVDEYYNSATVREQNQYGRGQMYWCPCLYLDASLSILYPRGFDPYHQEPPLWEARTVDARAFSDAPHKPLVTPRLEADEEFVVLVGKKRPVILFSSGTESWEYRGRRTREECFLVAPMYSFDDDDSPDFKLRMRALSYRELFYLPPHDTLGIREGFVRFDRMHCVPKRWLSRMGVRLHPDALQLLTDWFHFYLTGDMQSYIAEYRSELTSNLRQVLGQESD